MSFRTILANLNEVSNNETVLATAAALAREFQAAVTGLYVVPAARIYPSARYEPIPEMFEAHRTHFDRQARSVSAAFASTFAGGSVHSRLGIELSPSPLICETVIEKGRTCDLVLVSQTEMASRLGVELDFVPRVVMAAGRPVMVLPRESPLFAMPETVMIGWNGSREAARAVFDGLPILKRAKAVHLVWVDPPGERHKAQSVPGEDLVRSLKLHGIEVEAELLAGRGEDAGSVLLDRTASLGAGLLIIGAYGHSRLSEFILGGVTRTVLRRMRCPVLLSH
ncbi:MAG: universal stress protein [Parvibaculaceae bacterium]